MPGQHKKESLSEDETNRLMNACRTFEERFIIWTLLDTGLRANELACLKRANIQWQGKNIVIRGKKGPRGKGTTKRIIPMTDRVKRLFRSYFRRHRKVDISPYSLRKTVKNVAFLSKMPGITPNDLRRTFGVNCIRKGISMENLNILLGHSQTSTTENFLNLSPRDAVKEFYTKWYGISKPLTDIFK